MSSERSGPTEKKFPAETSFHGLPEEQNERGDLMPVPLGTKG